MCFLLGRQERHARWLFSFCPDHTVYSGAGRRLFSQSHTAAQGKAGSVSSSGLRREVQDSLSELERLIEQQHRQVRLWKTLDRRCSWYCCDVPLCDALQHFVAMPLILICNALLMGRLLHGL